MKHFVLLSVFVLLFSSMYAQNIIPRFENIGVNDGLSQSSVYSIYQDRTGFMWFGTADGLNRYDGQNIKVYKIYDKKIANSNFIHGNICEDTRSNIWFCNETGLFKYDPTSDKLIRSFAFKKYGWTAGVFIDKNDIFYIYSPDFGLYGYNTHTNKLQLTSCHFKSPYSNFSSVNLTSNNKNTIWIKAPDDGGMYIYNTQTNRLNFRKSTLKFQSVFYAGNGKLYNLEVPGKLTVTDTLLNVISEINYPVSQDKMLDIQQIIRDNYNRIWISTYDNGLLCYDEKTKLFTNYLHENSKLKTLPINILSALCIDRSGNLWIGTDGGGVCKLDLKPPKFNLFPLNEGDYPFLTDYFIKCFYENNDGQIWFGTHSSGLNIFDPGTGKIRRIKHGRFDGKSFPGPIITSILRDKDGLFWISASLGIALYDEQKDSLISVKVLNPPALNEHSNFVYKLIQLQNGELLAGTAAGLLLIKKVQGTYIGDFLNIHPENKSLITDVVEMVDRTIWVSSPLHGLLHYKRVNNKLFLIEKRFSLIDIRSIHRDEQDSNILWVCTGIGLVEFDTMHNKVLYFDEKNGMANSYVYGVLEDAVHNFWMSTNMGLVYFNRRDGSFQNYSVKDGLQSNEFNTQSFYKGASGNMFFGGIRGFNWFNPNSYRSKIQTFPGVAITSVYVDDKPYIRDEEFEKTNTIELNYDQNNISFQFAALDFTKPQANKVKFILEAWDKKWVTTDDKNIRYSHLLPGVYELKLKAENSFGEWSKQIQLTIVVNAPFWQKTWFYIISVICFLGVIIYVTYFISSERIKKRLRLLEKQAAIDAERNRISRDMHDEIGSGLTHIALLSELIKTQQNPNPGIKNDLNNISAAAQKLVASMSEIIWALNPQNDSLENLLSYIREQMLQLFDAFNINFIIEFPDNVPNITLSNEQRRNLYLITKEALNNVLKHSDAKNVKLSVRIDETQLLFEVKDDGRGMPGQKVKQNCNGLKNMTKRIEDIKGTIFWENREPGLSVLYAIKINV